MADSNVVTIKKFFYDSDTPNAKFMEEWKQLSEEDKEQLAEGIRNGTLTY